MKKSLIFASIACAGAFALRADYVATGFTQYEDWFKGIGAGVTSTNDMKATNGAWDFTGVSVGDVGYESGLVFDLDSAESISFNVTTPEISPDTNTWTDVKVSGVFTPVSTNDLPTQATMEARSAQVGFVVGISADPATNYYAWVGGANWVKLIGAVDPAQNTAETETTLLVTFDYTVANAAKARFAILTGAGSVTTNLLADSSSATWQSLATSNRKVSGISCYGSGKITTADGAVGLAVADVNAVKFGSLADAVDAGSKISGEAAIQVLRPTSESVTISGNNIKIYDPGNNVSGTVSVPSGTKVTIAASSAELNTDDSHSATNGIYAIPLNVTGDGTYVVTLPAAVAAYKEVAETNVEDSTIFVKVQTKGEFVREITPTGAGKALAANETKLREFLESYTNAAYVAATANASTMGEALSANGDNGIPLWQSYVMGADPTKSISPVNPPAGDTDKSNISLAIPSIDLSKVPGDFTVTYGVYKNGTPVGTAVANPAELKIPVTGDGVGDPTAQYTIKAVLTTPAP